MRRKASSAAFFRIVFSDFDLLFWGGRFVPEVLPLAVLPDALRALAEDLPRDTGLPFEERPADGDLFFLTEFFFLMLLLAKISSPP